MPIPVRERIYVLAYSRQEFRAWASEHRSARWRFEYAWRSDQVEGLRQGSCHVALLGWRERSNVAELEQAVEARELLRVEHDAMSDTITVLHVPPHIFADHLSTQIMRAFDVTPQAVGLPAASRLCPCCGCVSLRDQEEGAYRQLVEVMNLIPPGIQELTESVQRGMEPLQNLHTALRTHGFSINTEPTMDETVAESAAHADRVMRFDLDWPESSYGSTCAHVCGSDGHSCDVRATRDMTYNLPSGGKRTMPLCTTCYDAERRMMLDQEGR